MMDKKQKYKLKSFIRELEKIRGRHTELVSVYIPAGYDLNKIIQHLQQEQGTASNIKDKTNRKNVIDSLERMIRHLRIFKKLPERGLAVFAGNAAEKEGQVDIKVWSIEPPEKVNIRLYRCDQTFVLDLLKDMLEVKGFYGLLVMDNREANIGLLKGTSVTEINKMTSGVPGKIKAGGFSQQRYARLREGAANEFYKRIGEVMNKRFLGMKELKGILIGGPGPTKETFFDGNYISNELKKKVFGLKDLGYTGEFGLKELVNKSHDLLAKEIIIEETKILDRFFGLLATEAEKVAYSEKEVKKALKIGAVETLLLSEILDEKKIMKYEEEAENIGAEVRIISTETREGIQLKELGGIGAILRFAIS